MPELSKSLRIFFTNNDWSKPAKVDGEGNTQIETITSPWNDTSLEIFVPEDSKDRSKFVRTFNKIILPPSFSAIFHRDKKLFEVIYTAYKLTGAQIDVAERRFDFGFRGEDYHCEFGNSTEALLEVARAAYPRANSETRYRNLLSYSRYLNESDPNAKARLFGKPISFFVHGVSISDDEFLRDLVSNLNFHMSYFDLETPRILIHEQTDIAPTGAAVRYRRESFPNRIDGHPIDENVLSFWHEALGAHEMLRFMLHFRTIEYASISYSSEKVRKRILTELKRTDLKSDIERSADTIVEIFNGTETKVVDDTQRFVSTITEHVPTELLWKAIEPSLDFFSKDFECDGGFVIKALVTKNCKKENFFRQRGSWFCAGSPKD